MFNCLYFYLKLRKYFYLRTNTFISVTMHRYYLKMSLADNNWSNDWSVELLQDLVNLVL